MKSSGLRVSKKSKFIVFVVCALVLGMIVPFSQTAVETEAVWSDGWNNDLAEWRTYGNNGWTDTESRVPKWSGSNVAASQTGDPVMNPLAKPQPMSAEQVSYNQINRMAGSWSLDLPNLVTESVVYYAVYSPEQFRYAMVQNLNIKLMNDIDLRGQNNTSWGAVEYNKKAFIDGNNHTIYNLNGSSLISKWSQPLIVKNLAVCSAYMNVGLLGRSQDDTYISMENVSLEHAVLYGAGNSYSGGLISNAFYRSNGSGSYARVYANRCHTKNVYVYGGACSGNIFGPISGYVENCYAIDGTMRTGSHSGAFTSCAGNYIIKNCFTNVRAYANNNTGAFVGHVEDSVYTPGGDGVTKFINCYAAGSVEGNTNLGGFAAGAGICERMNTKYLFENCYSTAMVGMIANGNYQGGFLGQQESGATTTIRNCYAAGEVGALGTNLNDNTKPMGGFVGGLSGGSLALENCYYDKQTTAMKEKSGPGDATGLLTQDLMKTLPDGKSAEESAWVLTDGTYPQLKIFANNENLTGNDKNNADAYSKASVCTAMLYPSNLSANEFAKVDKTDYDTVRSLRFLFPLTNNTLANTTDGTYDISWESDGTKCTVDGMKEANIVTIKPSDAKNPAEDYSVISLAPGVGMVTVDVKRNGVIGHRQLRLVPTSAITMVNNENSAVTSGLDATIYAVPDGEIADTNLNLHFLTYKEVNYDHRIGIFFASGNDQGANVQKQGLEGTQQDTVDQFKRVDLNEKPGGSVLTIVQKKQTDGTFKELEMTDDLLKLFTGERAAQSKDIGEYYFNYRWYLNSKNVGGTSGYLETKKKLTIAPTVTPVFYQNYTKNDKTELSLPKGSIPENQDVLYYKNGDLLKIVPNDPNKTGYKFMGWSLDRDGFGENNQLKVDSNTLIDIDWANEKCRIPLYAIWQANSHTIHIKDLPNDESQDIDSAYGENIKEAVKDYQPSQDGKTFLGWTTDPDKNIVNIDEDDLMGDEDITLYPVWEAVPTVDKKVENISHHDKTMVDDELIYTIAIKNTEKHSTWNHVEIKDMLPPGLSFCPGSAVLLKPDGNEEKLPDSIYDSKKHAIVYKLDKEVNGDESYSLQFKLKVGSHAIDSKKPENANITNTVEVTGKNPDGSENLPVDPDGVTEDPKNPGKPAEPEKPGSSSAVPVGGVNVTPKDPLGYVRKIAVNKTDMLGQAQVDDRITYSISAGNEMAGSIMKNVSILDKLPKGLKLDTESLVLHHPDGTEQKLSGDVYDEGTRQIGVYIGDIYGNEAYILTFDVIVETGAIGEDIGNTAQIIGSRPSDEENKPGDDNPGDDNPGGNETELKPGDPYFPTEGEDGTPILPDGDPATIDVNTEDPVYPSGKDKPTGDGKGGVLPADAEPELAKEAENLTHPEGNTRLEDTVEYKVTLTNPKVGSLWKNIMIFDYLPEELVLDLHSLTLTYPDGHVESLKETVYDKNTRIIMVPIEKLEGGESYTLTYRASVKISDEGTDKAEDIVNIAEATGENPDGGTSSLKPEAKATIKFPSDAKIIRTGDNTNIYGYALIMALSGLMVITIYIKKKRRNM